MIPRAMKKKNIFFQLFVIFVILILVNLIGNQLFFRLDFTADKRYTLSKATKNVLADLEDVVTITAFFSEELPPQFSRNRRDLEDILIEYENRSGGNLVYEFINPNKDEESEGNAQSKGIQPVIVNVTERDQVQQLRAYMGAILQMEDDQEVIPLIQPGSAMEYSLTTAIKKISIKEKPKIAFLQGHGEPSIQASAQLATQLSVLYDIEPYAIEDDMEIPALYRTLAIIAPSDTFPSFHLAKLNRFLQNGGGIYLAYSNLMGELSNQYLTKANDIGLVGWLRQKGVIMNDHYVVDAKSASITVRQQQGPFVINTQVRFPYFPIVSNFADHPVGKGLESMILPFANAISLEPVDSSINMIPLAFTSAQSGLVQSPVAIDIQKKWAEADFRDPDQIVAAALEGTGLKLIVVPNNRFAVNGEGNEARQVSRDNINFSSNAIDWLSDDTGLIDLRTKGITSRPLDPINDKTRNMFKYGNFLLPIMLILAYGLFRRQKNLKRKQKWLQGQY